MSPRLYKCSEQAHLAHNYTLQFGYHVFSATHSAQTISYTRFNPVDISWQGQLSGISSSSDSLPLEDEHSARISCAYLTAGSEPLALHCSLKPILQLTMFNDSSGRHDLRSTLLQQMFEPFGSTLFSCIMQCLNSLLRLHSELFAQTITYYPTMFTVPWQLCLSSTAHYSHDKHILLTILNGYVVDVSFIQSILCLNVLESTHSLRPHWSTTLLWLRQSLPVQSLCYCTSSICSIHCLSIQFAVISAFSNFQAAQQVGRQCDPSGNVFL